MKNTIELSISRIRQFRKSSGLTKNRFAILSEVPEGCLRNIDDESWNPTAITLKKLESVIPPSFDPSKEKPRKSLPHKRAESKEIRT